MFLCFIIHFNFVFVFSSPIECTSHMKIKQMTELFNHMQCVSNLQTHLNRVCCFLTVGRERKMFLHTYHIKRQINAYFYDLNVWKKGRGVEFSRFWWQRSFSQRSRCLLPNFSVLFSSRIWCNSNHQSVISSVITTGNDSRMCFHPNWAFFAQFVHNWYKIFV